MTDDLSKLTDEELKALYEKRKTDVSAMSDEELKSAYAAKKKPDLEARVAAEREKMRKEFDPTQGMSGYEKFVAGFGGGLADKWLGAKQLAASAGFGDKEALAAEAAEKERLDKPLDTGWGAAGKFTGEMAPDLLLGGGLGAGAAKLLPQTARLTRALTSAGVQGAEAGLLTPGEHYDPVKEGLVGGLLGVGGDVVARGAGRVLRPMQAALPPRVKEQLAELAGMPGVIAENMSDSKFVKMLTNALGQLGPVGAGVNEARLAKLGAFTKEATGAGGAPTDALTEGRWNTLVDRLTGQGKTWRSGPDVPLPNISENLQPVLSRIETEAGLAGRSTPGTLGKAIEETTPGYRTTAGGRPSIFGTVGKTYGEQPNPSIVKTVQQAMADMPGTTRGKLPNDQLVDLLAEYSPKKGVARPGQFEWTGAGAPVGPTAPIRTADAVITARSLASKQSHAAVGTDDVLKAEGARKLAQELEDALVATHADKGQAFSKWKAEWGVKKDIEAVRKAGGLTPEGHVLPEAWVKRLETDEMRQAPLGRRAIALAERAPSPSLSENRSLAVRLLMGAGLSAPGAGLGALASSDNKTLGTIGGAGGSLALAHLLLGTKHGGRYLTGQTQSGLAKALQSEDLKRLLQMLAVSRGGEYGGRLGNQ